MLVAHWLWTGRSLPARIARLPLIPPSLMVRGLAAIRARVYRSRLLPHETLPLPTVAVGNLTVGGSGKTPIASWIAGYYASRGYLPGIVLRGYGGDEGAVHQRSVPGAVVVENPDRVSGGKEAASRGADVLILDDAYQRLDVGRDLNIAVVSAESSRAVRWTLPAGPWREGWRALKRADLVIVTRKRARVEVAESVARRVRRAVGTRPVALARLGIACFKGMLSGERLSQSEIRGTRVVAAAGIADPYAFAAQCGALGAEVSLIAWRDHQRITERDALRLAQVGRKADYIVVTEKDAVKLRSHWPRNRPEPLVATLQLVWEREEDTVLAALDAAVKEVGELVS
ncbi:MAG: tetraacyldisaccharide 4'-kinase [Gemmatimonadota bacterium]|nr:MAG: tetraacyldisaccharide 4'-kinase [Gemmatimonadota bacterium]